MGAKPQGRVMLEDLEQRGRAERPEIRPHRLRPGTWKLFSVMRTLQNAAVVVVVVVFTSFC